LTGAAGRVGSGVCTAYELGKRGGSFPSQVKARAMRELLGLLGIAIIRPTLPAPVILPDGELATMRWGFRRSFAPKVKGRPPVARTIVNSREDKLAGPTWREAFRERRCLIPAAAFYEWVERDGRNLPLRFTRPGDDWLWIAGIWEETAQDGRRFSMITTEPNARVEPVHDRMPALLAAEQIGPYLAGELHEFGPSAVELEFHEAANFLKPPPAQGELF
jgi:putative SOS response-associated peptidase YedK